LVEHRKRRLGASWAGAFGFFDLLSFVCDNSTSVDSHEIICQHAINRRGVVLEICSGPFLFKPNQLLFNAAAFGVLDRLLTERDKTDRAHQQANCDYSLHGFLLLPTW